MPLSTWMRPYMLKRNDTLEATHLLMDCGTLVVSSEQLPQFYRSLAQSILENEVNFLCEKRSAERLKLCVDMDIYTLEAYDMEKLVHIVRIAVGVAFDLFSKSDRCLDVLISAAETFMTEKNGQTCIKTGIHLVWENLPVSVRTAGIFRDALVQRLELSTLDAPIGGWSTAIDSAIAKHGILRMLFAHKIADCNSCRNKKVHRESCDMCLGKGRVDIGRPYQLKAVFVKAENRLETIPPATTVESIVNHLFRATIRTEETPIEINDNMPAWFENPLLPFLAGTKGRISKRGRRQMAATLDEGHDTIDGIMDKEQIHGDLVKKIEMYIRSAARRELIRSEFKDIDVTQALYAHDRSVIYAKTDSCYCLNTDHEHKSNTIYFELKRCGEMRQKCFCRCDTLIGRKNGLCSVFKSHPVNIPGRQLNLFFPPSSSTVNVNGSDAGSTPAGGEDQSPAGVVRQGFDSMRCSGLADKLKHKKYI